MCFLKTFARFSPAPVGRFSRTRLRGTQRGRRYTTAQVWSRAGSVARAMGVQSRGICQVITGLTQVGEKGHEGNSSSHSLFMFEETWNISFMRNKDRLNAQTIVW